MASSSGNSSSQAVNSSGSEEDLLMADERKRKRMQSNRESARRSRVRKQQRLDELAALAAQLRRDNAQIAASAGVAAQHLAGVEAENAVLRAQMAELAQRLQALGDIVGCIGNGDVGVGVGASLVANNAVNMVRLSLPIMANSAADMFMY